MIVPCMHDIHQNTIKWSSLFCSLHVIHCLIVILTISLYVKILTLLTHFSIKGKIFTTNQYVPSQITPITMPKILDIFITVIITYLSIIS